MRNTQSRALVAYWLELLGTASIGRGRDSRRRWPDRGQVEPSECRELLGDVFVLEILDGEARYRLAGSRLCGLYGREVRGTGFPEPFGPGDRDAAHNWAMRIGHDDACAVLSSTGVTAKGETVPLETLLLPLAHDGRRGLRTLGLTVPLKRPFWLGEDPIVLQRDVSGRAFQPWLEREHEPIAVSAPPIMTPEPGRPALRVIEGGLSRA